LFESALIQSGCVADPQATALVTGTALANNVGCCSRRRRRHLPARKDSASRGCAAAGRDISGARTPYQPNVDGSRCLKRRSMRSAMASTTGCR
jgi:hypothetical protein